MESKTLVERLRKIHEDNDEDGITIFSEAADRIAVLERQLAKCKEQRNLFVFAAAISPADSGQTVKILDSTLETLAEGKP